MGWVASGASRADLHLPCGTSWPQVLTEDFGNKCGRRYCLNISLPGSRTRDEGKGPHFQCIAFYMQISGPEAHAN